MINCALIGSGYWGSKLQKYIQENRNFHLECVCGSGSDLNRIWNDSQVKAVVIASPNETHYPLVKSALLSGKHVLAEKPLALEVAQCRELRSIARKNKLSLTVEYTYTFSKSLQLAQSLVADGEIGRILGIEMAVRHLGRFKGGSVYWLLGSHMLSVLDMFIPLPELLFNRKDLVTYDGEVETGVISFYKPGMSGQIVVSLNYPGKETRIIIYGELGTIVYDPMSQPPLKIEKYERLKWTVASKLPREDREFRFDENNNLRYAVEYFADAVEGKTESNIDRAVEITRILEYLQAMRVNSNGR